MNILEACSKPWSIETRTNALNMYEEVVVELSGNVLEIIGGAWRNISWISRPMIVSTMKVE